MFFLQIQKVQSFQVSAATDAEPFEADEETCGNGEKLALKVSSRNVKVPSSVPS